MQKNAVHRLLRPLLVWRARHVSERMYMLLLSILVGALAGLAAVILKSCIRWQADLLQAGVSEPYRVFALSLYPVVGIGLTVLPDYSVHGDPLERAGLIVSRPLAGDTTTITLTALHRRQTRVLPAILQLLWHLREQARQPRPARTA